MIELMILTQVEFSGKLNRVTLQYLVFKNYITFNPLTCKRQKTGLRK